MKLTNEIMVGLFEELGLARKPVTSRDVYDLAVQRHRYPYRFTTFDKQFTKAMESVTFIDAQGRTVRKYHRIWGRQP